MRLLIFAPVVRREWIIDRWLENAAASAEAAGVDCSFLLLGGMNDPTFDVVDGLPQYDVARIYVDESRDADVRDWAHDRFQRMAELRNILLGYVRHDEGLDYALSLDTDVLLHPDTIGNLIESQAAMHWDAVGGYCYLSENRRCPSYGALPAPWVIHRPDIPGEVHVCSVLMAIILMTAPAWNVDYAFNEHGEDIGWALNAKKAELKVGVDARVTNKHVMTPSRIDIVDPRCGF